MSKQERVVVIAEAGVNHNGSLALARELVAAAAEAKADMVKFQTFSANKLACRNAAMAAYQVANTGRDSSQREMLRRLELSLKDHFELKTLCAKLGIEFVSSPFDCESLRFLVNDVCVGRLKIPSGEMINGPLILAAARSRLPLILSSGMCDMADIKRTLALIAWADRHDTGFPSSIRELDALAREDGWLNNIASRVWLLHCVSQYPTPPADLNLRAIAFLRDATGLRVGLSDHSAGRHLTVASVAAGATVIEKHFTLSRRLPGPDHAASLEPDELSRMIAEIRDVEVAMGDSLKRPGAEELRTSLAARGSITASSPIRKGEAFDSNNLAVKRPGSGLSPLLYWDLINGGRALRDYDIDEQIAKDEYSPSCEEGLP